MRLITHLKRHNYLVFFVGVLLLSACSPGVPEVQKRFFFPPSPATPKIEYIKSYFSDHDLKSGQKSFLTEYVLGENRPVPIFSTPIDVASDGSGRVYVTDSGLRKVLVLDIGNPKYRFLSPPEGGSVLPYGVTVAEDGHVYVVDALAKQVDIFDGNENFLLSCIDKDFHRPVAAAVDVDNDRLYVLDTAAHRVTVFNTRCDLVGHFGERGDGPGTFNFPTDIDVDAEGNIYVLDALNARVQVFDKDQNFLRLFGERGTADGSFQIPKNLAVSERGHLYVTDALAHKVVIFSTEGDFLLRIGGKFVVKDGVAPGGFYSPRGVTIDQKGGLWVVDSLNRMVHRFQFLTPEYLRENPVPQNLIQAQ